MPEGLPRRDAEGIARLLHLGWFRPVHCKSVSAQETRAVPEGHAAVADLARDRDAAVCFESTGGQEWQLWALLEAEDVAARQVPPAKVKMFAQSRDTRANTDRIDAELIVRFFAFRPEAGRSLPAEKIRLLRALTSKRAQLVEMRKRLLAKSAHIKNWEQLRCLSMSTPS